MIEMIAMSIQPRYCLYCLFFFQPIFETLLVRPPRWKACGWTYVMLDGSRRTRNWPGRYSLKRCSPFSRKKLKRSASMVKTQNRFHLFWCLTNFRWFDIRRGNISRHSSRRALVRTMAWDIFVSTTSIRSWIHSTFLELPHRSIEYWFESIRNRKRTDAKSANDAKCDATEATKMVYDRHTKLLRIAARSQSQWSEQVSMLHIRSRSRQTETKLPHSQCTTSIRNSEIGVWRRQVLPATNKFASESRTNRQYWSVAEIFAPTNEKRKLISFCIFVVNWKLIFRSGISIGSWQCAEDASRCQQCDIDAIHRYDVVVGNTTVWYYCQRRSRRSSAESFPRAGHWGNRMLSPKSLSCWLKQI